MHTVLDHDYFAPLVGKSLPISSQGKSIGELKLDAVEVLPKHNRHQGDDIRPQPFSLLFTSAPELRMNQGMLDFALSNDRMESIFIVPLGPAPDKRWKYEAVFN
ncbi:hypothetical protein [Roseimicrobium sp. ORNL1]|uniref:DUF6916 family protein n=1 Tax=Roseimicrobium sp. ORNL1 TaxID=2711231 RepID=UPI0013E17D58|nr:hypothetical protein [Roseimicrobium sp. ORNL1]QIF02902.1 hypothetical protein G5S37_15705 [Roseimicrobium sp. ORNL1]